MENMMKVFLRLMEIINDKNNCIHHYEVLRKLVKNFNVVYTQVEEGLYKQEADAYTYALDTKINMIHEKKLGRKED